MELVYDVLKIIVDELFCEWCDGDFSILKIPEFFKDMQTVYDLP